MARGSAELRHLRSFAMNLPESRAKRFIFVLRLSRQNAGMNGRLFGARQLGLDIGLGHPVVNMGGEWLAVYAVECNLDGQEENVRNILMTFDPNAQVGQEGETRLEFFASPESDGAIRVKGKLVTPQAELAEELVDWDITDPRYSAGDRVRRERECIRLACLRLMERHTGSPPSPWGILTGVRPTKILHLLRQAGFSPAESLQRLQKVYALEESKARLLMEIGQAQKPYLAPQPMEIGIYVGIPFCPTRCDYCSFASYPLSTHGHHIGRFSQALQREIAATEAMVRRLGLRVSAVYVGGGTPTALPEPEFAALMDQLASSFAPSMEFSVEAGRPDTIDAARVSAMARHGVTRVSVNPQTMNDKTLALLKREHTSADIRAAFRRVRESGIPVINMDLIAGLPGEGLEDMTRTLDAVEEFGPENLSVHTLAIKRASNWRRLWQQLDIAANSVIESMLAAASERARAMGMQPYYLYRQRFIMANLENIGYACCGAESPYNIQMIEEQQTVIGLGGGGVTRMVGRSGGVARLFNPKCPATYATQVEGLIARKVRSIETLFR